MINKIIVTGPPASGKSTLIEIFREYLTKKQIKCKIINDFDVLVSICPKNNTSDQYYYDTGGMLVLKDEYRSLVMEKQYHLLNQIWNDVFEGVIIMELSSPDLEQIINSYFTNIKNSLLIIVKSRYNFLVLRNNLRLAEYKIPNNFINLFNKQSIESEVRIGDSFAKIETIDNNLSKADYEKRCNNLILKLINE